MRNDGTGAKNIGGRHEDGSGRKEDDYYKELWNDFEQDIKDKAIAEEVRALRNKIKSYEELLTRSMREIAESNASFKETYEKQQQLWAEWVIEKLAYKEAAIRIGIRAGMTLDQIERITSDSYRAVLRGETRHVENAYDDPFLAAHATAIFENRRLKGQI